MKALPVRRKMQNVMEPFLVDNHSNLYELYSAGASVMRPGLETTIPTGLAGNGNAVAMIVGRLPTKENGNMEVRQSFVGCEGDINFMVTNRSGQDSEVKEGTPLSLVAFLVCDNGEYELVDVLDETERGSSGYGSTGVN